MVLAVSLHSLVGMGMMIRISGTTGSRGGEPNLTAADWLEGSAWPHIAANENIWPFAPRYSLWQQKAGGRQNLQYLGNTNHSTCPLLVVT